MEETSYLELTKGKVRVEWEDIGEGWSGDYDENDPEDTPLLRFTVLKHNGGYFEQVDNGSYCTAMPTTTPKPILEKSLQIIMDAVYNEVVQDYSIKKACEYLSWLSPEDFEQK